MESMQKCVLQKTKFQGRKRHKRKEVGRRGKNLLPEYGATVLQHVEVRLLVVL